MRFAVRLLFVCHFAVIAGCPPSKPPPKPGPTKVVDEVELRLLVVDDEPLAAATRAYLDSRGAKVTVEIAASAELLARQKPGADLLVYPAGLLGELAERNWLQPLPPETLDSPEVQASDILKTLRQAECKWGVTTIALPLGSPQFTLYYRADVFQSLGLRPPETWTEYRELAERLGRREELGALAPPADAPWYGTLEPLAPGWAGQLFLARAAAYIQDRGELSTLFDHRTMKPLVDRPAFVRALEELVAVAKLGPADRESLTPAEVHLRFLQNQSAMAIVVPDRGEFAREKRFVDLSIGFAELPGSREVFRRDDERWRSRPPEDPGRVPLLNVSGRLVSAVRRPSAPRQALQLVALLTGGEAGQELSSASAATSPFRTSQTRHPEAWLIGPEKRFAEQFGLVVKQQTDRDAWVHSPRIPGRQAYLDALDEAVKAALADEPAAPTLAEAARKWTEITAARGLESQQRAYVRSHGLEP